MTGLCCVYVAVSWNPVSRAQLAEAATGQA
jgi:hypothetical protein